MVICSEDPIQSHFYGESFLRDCTGPFLEITLVRVTQFIQRVSFSTKFNYQEAEFWNPCPTRQICITIVLERKERKFLKEKSLSRVQLWDPMNCSPPGSSILGILQARILKWVVISFSKGTSWPRDRTQVSCIAGRRFNLWATRGGEYHDSIQTHIDITDV